MRRQIDIVGHAVAAAEDIAFGIGAAEVEIGIGEGIDHRIGFEIFVEGADTPIAALEDFRVTDGDARLIAVAAAGKCAAVVKIVLRDLGGNRAFVERRDLLRNRRRRQREWDHISNSRIRIVPLSSLNSDAKPKKLELRRLAPVRTDSG